MKIKNLSAGMGRAQYAFLMVCIGMGLWSCGQAAEENTGHLIPYGTGARALESGWILVSTNVPSATSFLEALPQTRWAAFTADQIQDQNAGQDKTHALVSGPLKPNKNYWVYVEVKGHEVDPDVLSAPAAVLSPNAWGRFFSPPAPARVTQLGAKRVLEWDLNAQQFTPFEGALLEEGRVYWIEFQAHQPVSSESQPQESASAEYQTEDSIAADSKPKEPVFMARPEQIEENYIGAKTLVDSLFDHLTGAQREYTLDVLDEDSAYLSQYGRVWAYGQGIALALYSRRGHDARAERVADFICRTAVPVQDESGEQTMGGWYFSSNTFLDNWKDMRLVTGANAWVIHGLGAYLASDSFEKLTPERQHAFYNCYMDGLYGLMVHFEPKIELMTAGWTTKGLKNADTPSKILEHIDPTLSWAYYDILDAIGYDLYNALKPPIVQTLRWEGDEPKLINKRVLSLEEHGVLRERAKASNVVTEHNLDTLSVINHLLRHWDQIQGFASTETHHKGSDQRYDKSTWTAFRNRLNRAIFTSLWNDAGGRVVTGGELVHGQLEPNHFSAIDNCTWLSLSVDYASLSPHERDKLARCLDYTINNFAKDLEFKDNRYFGAHYFPKGFKDRYIRPDPDQEKLYHLEATTGLILGLFVFVDAHPQHPRSAHFERTANRLWSDMQRFVKNHGFPYSTHRIQNLKTELQSNTSAIWFIDVYDYLAARQAKATASAGAH